MGTPSGTVYRRGDAGNAGDKHPRRCRNGRGISQGSNVISAYSA